MLLPSEIILIPHDIILTCVVTALHLDDDEWLSVSVREAMEVSERDMTSLVLTEYAELLYLCELWITDIDRSCPRDYCPLFTPMLVRLK